MHARLANRILSWELRRRLGLDLTDLGPMRAVGRTALLGLGIPHRRSGWPLEMVVRAGHQGWRIGEMPVAYHPRIGRSKVTGTVRGTITAVRDMHQVLSDPPSAREPDEEHHRRHRQGPGARAGEDRGSAHRAAPRRPPRWPRLPSPTPWPRRSVVTDARLVVALDGPPGPWLRGHVEVVPQRGADLGRRLAHLFVD